MESSISKWLMNTDGSANMVICLLFSAMVAILFIQSGLDKVVNWKGELSFYKDHFKKTFFKPFVGALMPIITTSELLAGLFSAVGFFVYLFGGTKDVAILGMFFACLSIIQLFLGQRIAKDYSGAAALVPYFFLTAFGLYFYLI